MLAAADAGSQHFSALVANYAILGLGGIVVLAWVVAVGRTGRWRNPLHDLPAAPRPFEPAEIILLPTAPIFTYLFVATVVFLPLAGQLGGDFEAPVNSPARHIMTVADAAAKLVAAAVMLFFLRFIRVPLWPMRRSGRYLALVAVLGTLAATGLCAAQLHAVEQLWRQLALPLPVHQAIETLATIRELPAWVLVFMLINTTLVAAISEELFFRGVLLEVLWRNTRRVWIAILISGLFFGWMHASVAPTVLPLTTFGIILGYLRFRYDSLLLCIGVHALFNLRTVLLVLYAPELAAG